MATSKAGPNQLLCSIQVTGLAAGQSDFYSTNNITNNDSAGDIIIMTPNSVNYTEPLTNTYWHGLVLEVEPGVLNQGQAEPDIQMWFDVDGVSYKNYIYVDLSISRNMLPVNVYERKSNFIKLGDSLFQAARFGNFGRANIPLNFTGPKIAQEIKFHFSSTAGFTTSPTGTFASPPTIRLWGDVYDEATWAIVVAALGGAFPGAINMQSIRRSLPLVNLPPFLAQFQVKDLSLANGFVSLPDGPKQGQTKVHRFLKYATNLAAASGAAPYPLTSLVQGVGGVAGQVGAFNELGFQFNKTGNALRVSQWGHRPGAGCGYIGLLHGANDYYPYDTPSGLVDTAGYPKLWYGLDLPVQGIPNEYLVMPKFGTWNPSEMDKEVLANENIAFYIMAQSGLTIAAKTDYTAVGGVMVES